MELEELKSAWATLDARLQNQELLRAALLRETLKSKSDTALGRMINYGYFGLTIGILGICAMIWIACTFTIPTTLAKITYYGALLCVIYGTVQQIIGLHKLQSIDYTRSVSDNLQSVCNYQLFYRKQMVIILIWVAIIILAAVLNYLIFFRIETWRLICCFGALAVGAIGGVWEYKRMYRKNIAIIKQSLEELKGLE
jgi:hypothetical protein